METQFAIVNDFFSLTTYMLEAMLKKKQVFYLTCVMKKEKTKFSFLIQISNDLLLI
jgi:hypothetical protein